MSKDHNENTRVQVPAALHLCKLGYTYHAAYQDDEYEHRTNIMTDVFLRAVQRLNPSMNEQQAKALLDKIVSMLNNDDLGREFYQLMSSTSGTKLIDFTNPDNNEWHVTTEFECVNEETGDSFRPDLTCFINGLPLAFVEVKKPNNKEGMLAERDRAETRMSIKAFRRFINITQLMIYSNNEEYLLNNRRPVSGSYYATISKERCFFNLFREEDENLFQHASAPFVVPDDTEQVILTHRNCLPIRHLPEYIANCNPQTPCNSILTSMLSRERFLFLLRYGFAYVNEKRELQNGEQVELLQKHVMRYQQLFATLAIRNKLDEGLKGGIIWHTQGSGKTALSFYNIRSLTDYYSARNTAVKFYFIVDRLDLLEQAKSEFTMRGLTVRTAQTREELMADFKSTTVINNAQGDPEVMVVNIQRFAEDHRHISRQEVYSLNLRRVFFIDEAHRGYTPKGSFLANLLEADKDAVRIALTGTPLIRSEHESWKVFGNYIHTYYYDKSIADGYTLKLLREDIEKSYKERIEDIINRLAAQIKVKSSDIDKDVIEECDNYVDAILDYAVQDLKKCRIQNHTPEVAGMIVCKTNPQARKMMQFFEERFSHPADGSKPMKAYLILHDEGGKQERKGSIDEFKKMESVDFLIVNNMLLTGFDAPRLKKLYLCRTLNDHNLLQALTRVNRPYKDFKYGYVVDFANIKQNFIDTNNAYLRELERTTSDVEGVDLPTPGESLIVSPEEIEQRLDQVKTILFNYDTTNLEYFSEQIRSIDDKVKLYELRHALEDVKSLLNQSRSFGSEDVRSFFAGIPIHIIVPMISEVSHRIDRINMLDNQDHTDDVSAIINEVLSELEFSMRKRGEEELQILYNDLRDRYKKINTEFQANFDKQDDKYVDLAEEFHRYFREKGFEAQDVQEMKDRIGYMDAVMKRIREINRLNNMMKRKYKDDEKFVRIHKRIVEANHIRQIPPERPIISAKEYEVVENLSKIKDVIDKSLYWNIHVMQNEGAFNQDVLRHVSLSLSRMKITSSIEDRKFIQRQIAMEYMNRYNELQDI